MRYRLALLAMVCAAFGGSLAAQRWLAEPLRSKQAPTQARRIVSMAPSITETLYALGLGDRVVGVSRDSRYPPQVESVKRSGDVGGYFDPNFEAILARKPDLVLMLEEQAGSLPAMAKLDLQTLLVCHKSIDGIIDSFGTIGRACGKGAEAERMQRDYRDRLAKIHQGTRHLARPRVLIVLDRIYGSGHLADVYIAGHDDYFDRVIGLAGGQNAYRHGGIRYPVLSAEGILRLDPEVIVDLVPPATLKKVGRQPMLDDWKDVNTVAAVKSHRLLIFAEDYAMVPGPRFIRLVEDLARDFHPEVGRSGS